MLILYPVFTEISLALFLLLEIWKTNIDDCVKQFILAVKCVKHDVKYLEFVNFIEEQDQVYKVVKKLF